MKVKIFLPNEKIDEAIVMPILCHGKEVAFIESGKEDLNNYDGLVTKNKNLTLGIKTGDCAPVCFADGEKIGIAHIGWPGLYKGLTEEMVEHFEKEHTKVFVGPFIHNFEIQRDFCYDLLALRFREFIKEENGRLFFDFKKALSSLLPEHTVFDPRNTFEDNSLPSHRRDKTKERITTTISL